MADIKWSGPGAVFGEGSDARKHGLGGIWYRWKDPQGEKKFPDDVRSVMTVLPVTIEGKQSKTSVEWPVVDRLPNGSLWSLSGTIDKPTLSPSLHLVGHWHGFLRNGNFESC